MTEWLTQYEKVAQRQQQYLQKIRDLRQRLQTKDERHVMLSIERLRKTPRDTKETLPSALKKADYKSHVPWSSSLLAHSFYPKMSCPSPRLLAAESSPELSSSDRGNASYACVVSGERLLPKHHPKHLNPLATPRHFKDRSDKMAAKGDMTLERNKTDYEPIESIAKRNQIQFSGYLTSGDDKVDEERAERKLDVSKKGRKRQQESCGLSVVAYAGDVLHREV